MNKIVFERLDRASVTYAILATLSALKGDVEKCVLVVDAGSIPEFLDGEGAQIFLADCSDERDFSLGVQSSEISDSFSISYSNKECSIGLRRRGFSGALIQRLESDCSEEPPILHSKTMSIFLTALASDNPISVYVENNEEERTLLFEGTVSEFVSEYKVQTGEF